MKGIANASQLHRRIDLATVSLIWSINVLKRLRLFICCFAGFVLACTLFAIVPQASAQGGLRFIRDTEIENTIRVYVAPLFEAAGLDPGAVSVHIVNDNNLNAFVAGGQRIFIHTGLLMQANAPGEVIGVLAHEIGHITGGHLARMHQGLKDATNQSILALVLGGAAALASGSPNVLVAGATASASVGQRSFLSYTRTMEQSADQAALAFLDSTEQSAQGLLDFLELLSKQEKIFTAGGNPYMKSHPLTTARIDHVREHIRKSPYSSKETDLLLRSMHDRMRGKLKGFINPPAVTFREFPPEDLSMGAHYARAIAYSKAQETDTAVAIIDELIAASPTDPFLYELKGDLLIEGGRTQDAVTPYEKALEILPWAALIKISLARLQLENGGSGQIELARDNLIEALRYEPEMASAWRFLATAEGRLGNHGAASLALAEEAMLRGNRGSALAHSKRAMERLPEGSPGWFRAQDIESMAKKTE